MQKWIGWILLMAMSLPIMAEAQDKKKAPKRTTIDFEDELIQGEAQKPELFYLLQKKQFNYKKMIRLRENFLPEMRKTSEDVEMSGGRR